MSSISTPPTETQPISAVPHCRQSRIVEDVRTLLHEQSGMPLVGIDPAVTFLDLGFDSLFLTQAAQAVGRKFGVKITFRNMLEDAPTPAALAELLDQKMPPDPPVPAPPPVVQTPAVPIPLVPVPAVQASAPVPVFAPATVPAPVSGSALEQVIAQQLQVMSAQLELLRGGTPAPAAALLLPTPAPLALSMSAVPALTAAPPLSPLAPVPSLPTAAFGPYKPIDTAPGGGLTPRQQEHLDQFIAGFTRKTAESKRLTQLHRPHLADPRAVAGFKNYWKEMVYPIVAECSAGANIWDVDGNKYVDLTMGFGVNLFGHSPAFITEAITAQLPLGVEIGPQSTLAGEVAQMICEMTGTERATFCNTGSEAVMAALRAARTVTGRTKVAYFTGDYHGTFDEVLARANKMGDGLSAVPVAPGIPGCMTEEVMVLDYGTPETLEILRAHAHELAAVLVEPVQSRRPDLQPREFLHEIRRLTAEAGAALIFDEVITGFRIHPGGAQAWFGIEADLATYGKIVGGGMPIGILTGKAEYMDAFDGGQWQYGDGSWPDVGVTFFAGTFVRHPLALAAAKATLLHLKTAGPQLQENLNARTTQFVAAVNADFEEAQVPVRLANFGSLFYFKFASDLKWSSLLYYHLRAKGVHLWEGRPCFLSTAHTDNDIAFIVQAFRDSVAEMQEGGFLPESTRPKPPAPRTVPKEIITEIITAPLTEPQKEVWLATQISSDASCALIESLSVHLDGDLNVAALQAALQQVVDRHEALRTTFPESGDFQQIHPSLTLEVPVVDFSALSDEASNAALAGLLAREGRMPFDLVAGPLFRAQIVRLEARQHVLVLTAHHLVCDGWSSGILLSEVGTLYAANTTGQPANLEPPLLFHHYARQQSSSTVRSEAEEAAAYWRAHLTGALPALELPTDRTRPATQTFRGARAYHTLDATLLGGLRRLGAREGCTFFTTLFAGFALLLQRLSSQTEVIVGVPAAGQSRLKNPCLVGHCVNLLPVHVVGPGDTPFAEYLRSVKELVFAAYDHQDCTFGQLLQSLPGSREAGRAGLVSATFNLDRYPTGLNFGPLEWTVETNPRSFFQFDFSFNIVETKHGATVECDYNTDLFEGTTIQRWMGHFETLLHSMVEEPNRALSALPLLSTAERTQILQTWSRRSPAVPPTECVQALFEAQAAQTPDAIAVEYGTARLTYGELNARANQLAHWLHSHGVGPDRLVGVLIERSLEMVIALLATLKAGGAYLPLDPVYPPERLQFMLDDARPSVIVSLKPLAAQLSSFAGPVFCLDADWDCIAGLPRENLVQETTPENLVYVIYTSGSTGHPKGVAVAHRGVVRLVKDTDYIDFGADQVFMQLASLSFDGSTFEIWGPLLNGGRLVVMPAQMPSLEEIGSAIRRHGITTAWLTAGLFHALIDYDIEALRPLQQLVAGGDTLSVAHCRRVLEELPNCRLVNGYGPTECTTFAVCHDIHASDLRGATVPIGTPIANTSAYILDNAGQPVPIGVEGELWLGGAGVAREYLHRAELTAARFVRHTFEGSSDDNSAERLYATGDRVRWRTDGVIEFRGRRDEQVKIRGFRVEIGEIEQALLAHPAVRQAVVLALEEGTAEKRLVAYVIADPNAALTSEGLTQFAGSSLPSFLMPSLIVFLSELPLLPSGKPDRKALPRPEPASRMERSVPLEARDEIEQDLVQIWQKILNIPAVHVDDNFFDLGGHSLLALRLFGEIEKKLGVSLPFPTIFQAKTIALLAARLRQKSSDLPPEPLLIPIQPSGSRPPLYCIHPDHGLVLFYHEMAQHLSPDQPVYGLQAVCLTEGTPPDTRIEDMAARYIREIRVFQPDGPYSLAGYSLGGVIAYEMAQQLHRQGQAVPFLGLLDTYAPVAFQQHLIEKSPLQRTTGHLSILKGMGLKEQIDYLKHKSLEVVQGKKNDWQNVQEELQESLSPQKLEALRQMVLAHEQANFAYLPQPYFGKTTLFRAAELDVFEHDEPTLWWSKFCVGGLDIREVPGSHWNMMKEPYVQSLTQELQIALAAAYADDLVAA